MRGAQAAPAPRKGGRVSHVERAERSSISSFQRGVEGVMLASNLGGPARGIRMSLPPLQSLLSELVTLLAADDAQRGLDGVLARLAELGVRAQPGIEAPWLIVEAGGRSL